MSIFVLPLLLAMASIQSQSDRSRLIVLSYQEAIACAGVTQAMSELEGGESEHGKRLYDAALYWSLTAIQLGQASGRLPLRTEADLTNARFRAVRELNRRDKPTLERLENCIDSTPSLD